MYRRIYVVINTIWLFFLIVMISLLFGGMLETLYFWLGYAILECVMYIKTGEISLEWLSRKGEEEQDDV